MNFLSTILHAVLSFLDGGLFELSAWHMVVYTLVVTHITIAGVTIYLHRHQAHRSLEMHPIASHFFRFWLWLTTGQVTKEWAAVHRKHHAKCETEEDPHSPQVRGIKKVLLEGAELYRAETKNQETLDKYGHGCPNDWIERKLYTPYSWVGVSMLLPLNVMLFGVAGITIWAVQMAWIPVTAAGIINGIGHYWGYRNFACADASRNIVPWGILIGGEELHNNHHAYGTSAKLSSRWYEFDIGWMYIRMLELVGLAKVRKVAPKLKRASAVKHVPDLATLQAVITHRYSVASHYAKAVRDACALEIRQLRERGAEHLPSTSRLKRWLAVDDATVLAEPERATLAQLLERSHALKTIYAMRQELNAVWERSTESSEQLLLRLQDWCRRAEASGIPPLARFAVDLKRFA